jgi:hypothetical protein
MDDGCRRSVKKATPVGEDRDAAPERQESSGPRRVRLESPGPHGVWQESPGPHEAGNPEAPPVQPDAVLWKLHPVGGGESSELGTSSSMAACGMVDLARRGVPMGGTTCASFESKKIQTAS